MSWLGVATQLGPLIIGFVSVVGSLFWSSRVVDAKNAELAALARELRAKDGELAAITRELKVKDGEVAAITRELKVKDGEVGAIDRELRVKEAELSALANIFEQRQILIELQAKYEARAAITGSSEMGP